jgi:hypothetical protein
MDVQLSKAVTIQLTMNLDELQKLAFLVEVGEEVIPGQDLDHPPLSERLNDIVRQARR